MQLAIAQLDQRVGDLAANARGILAAVAEAERAGATLVVTPELSLCGYPPEDLLLRPAFLDACARGARGPCPASDADARCWSAFRSARTARRYNAMAVVRDGRVHAGLSQADSAELHGVRRGALLHARQRAVRVRRRRRALSASSSARTSGSRSRRRARRPPARRSSWCPTARRITRGSRCCAASRSMRAPANADCRSSTSTASAARTSSCSTARRSSSMRTGALAQQVPAWHETVAIASFDGATPRHVRGSLDAALEPHVYEALVMGVRDYVGKNRFPGVLLGLSGGVDSALTLAVAVDALGADRVRALMLPSPYNAPISLDDAREMAGIVGVRYDEIPIEPVFRGVPRRAGAGIPRPAARRHRGEHPGAHSRHAADGAVEQVRLHRADHRQQVGDGGRLRDAVRRHGRRLRGAEGHPARRSSTGCATTATVWAASFRSGSSRARRRRSCVPTRPTRTRCRRTTCSTASSRRTSSTTAARREIVAMGFPADAVAKVVRLIKISEYKRRQSAVGIRITPRGFGKDWRYPITSAWNEWRRCRRPSS